MLQQFFLTFFDISIAAGYCAIFVMIIRLFMKKLPKSYSYALWVIVFVRLMMPVVPESAWSLLPEERVLGMEQVMDAWQEDEQSSTGMEEGAGSSGDWIATLDGLGNDNITNVLETENKEEWTSGEVSGPILVGIGQQNLAVQNNVLTIFSGVWFGGIVILLGYGIISIVLLKRRLKNAVQTENGIYELANLPTAFVIGIMKPRIYLPADLPEEYRRYVLAHEKVHLQRGDVWIKHIACFLACVHWFNPLVWLAYHLMCRDMEMSCDERVLRTLGMEEKKAYSTALLSIASGRKLQLGMPVAFSESNAKERIKNVLNYRKPTFWVTIVAGIVVVGLAMGLLCDPGNVDTEEAVITENESAAGSETGVNAESEDLNSTEAESSGETNTELTAAGDSSGADNETTKTEVESEETRQNFMPHNPQYLEQVEEWIDAAASPVAMGFSNWFVEYNGGEKLQRIPGSQVKEDASYTPAINSDIIFYRADEGESIREIAKKMMDAMMEPDEDRTFTITGDALEEWSILEVEKYDESMWLIKYLDRYYEYEGAEESFVYLLTEWWGIYRLQRLEDMMQYREKEVQIEYVPIYAEDLSDKAILSEKLSEAVNIIFLFRDYEHVNEMDPVDDRQVVFDNTKGYVEEDIIHYYFDEEKFYEAMARKMGQDMSEFLMGHNMEITWYRKLYRGWPNDSLRMDVDVTDVKWLDASQAEIYYSNTYFHGVVVMKEYDGEMVFVSNQRREENN